MKEFSVGVFDSGVGGIKVLERLRREYPSLNFVYLFDKSGLPYGDKTTQELKERAFRAVKFLESKGCDIVIIACNTQTVASLQYLKDNVKTKIFGVLPPIDCALNNGYQKILLLATPYTIKYKKEFVQREEVEKLIFAPQTNLAKIIETDLHKKDIINNYVDELFKTYYSKIDSIVLGCTHYYFIKKRLEDKFGVRVFDGVDNLLDKINSFIPKNNRTNGGFVRFFYS